MNNSLLNRAVAKRPDMVRLEGRILFLTEDPELIKRQLAGEDLPWDTQHPDALVLLVQFLLDPCVLRNAWAGFSCQMSLFSFEDVFNIPLAVQNSNDAHSVIVQEIINSDGFESCNRPGAQILELRIARTIARTHPWMLTQRSNGAPDRIPEANRNLCKIQGNEVIAKLAHNIVAGRMPIRNLHERGPLL